MSYAAAGGSSQSRKKVESATATPKPIEVTLQNKAKTTIDYS
jgi:hypothetical protein